MNPRGIGHVLVDHFRQPEGRSLGVHLQYPADGRIQRRRRPLGEQRDRPAREIRRIQPAQRQVRIRHRRPLPAAPVTGRSRLRPRRFRPHPDLPHRVHMGQRPAPGADLHHVDDGDRDRHPRPLLEPVGPRHLEHPRRLGRQVADQADLRRGPAHVKAQHLVQPIARRDMRGKDRAPRRPGFHQPHGKLRRALDRDDPAARMHQEHRAIHPLGPQPRLQPSEIALHQRLDIGIGNCRVEALVFPHLRADLARKRNHRPRQPLGQNLAHHLLMGVVLVGMQQPHRDRGEAGQLQPLRQRLDLGPLQRDQHIALRIHPLAQRIAELARQQRLGQGQVQVVLLEPALGAHLDDVAKALGGDQRCLRPAPLDQRIGRQRRAMDDLLHVAQPDARLGADPVNALRDGVLGRGIGGQHLGGKGGAIDFQHHVGEGAANVDAHADRLCHESSLAEVAIRLGAPNNQIKLFDFVDCINRIDAVRRAPGFSGSEIPREAAPQARRGQSPLRPSQP